MIETMATRPPEITPPKWMALWTGGIFCSGAALTGDLRGERPEIRFSVSSHVLCGLFFRVPQQHGGRIRLKAADNVSFYWLISFSQSVPENLCNSVSFQTLRRFSPAVSWNYFVKFKTNVTETKVGGLMGNYSNLFLT